MMTVCEDVFAIMLLLYFAIALLLYYDITIIFIIDLVYVHQVFVVVTV